MSIRSEVLSKAEVKRSPSVTRENLKQSHLFGARVFGRRQIEQNLPEKQAANWLAAIDGKEKIEKEYLDLFADALKEWALRSGATHFSHWFQPLTGFCAGRQDVFLSHRGHGMIESFNGKDLLQGEPDVFSFPNGGLRCTSEARGYILWDPSTSPFLWNSAEELTLCIPCLFFSSKGQALDYKIPLLRSEQKIQNAALRLLKVAGIETCSVFSTLGLEQEYFTIDRALYGTRPDLMLVGRTLYGAKPTKGQKLENHYFLSLDERTLAFTRDLEDESLLLGIPLKTCHNEVVPFFEKASHAADYNLLLMELMRKVAKRHDLACLFHEKPFIGLNGSGKHCNWSLETSTGLNLLDPKEDSFVFFVLLAAILRAVHEHSLLLHCSVASSSNGWRLSGSEASPTILSICLGGALQECIEKIIHEKEDSKDARRVIDLGLRQVLSHDPDTSDCNHTSFFAFTGKKFEFRAVGASQHVAWPICIVNSIVADSLHLILDEIEDVAVKQSGIDLLTVSLPVLRKHFKAAQPVVFSGNNYAKEWDEEARRRRLADVKKNFYSYAVLRDAKTERVFRDVLSKDELESHFEILTERYAKEMDIECSLMIDLFRTSCLPAALRWQKECAKSLDLLISLQIGSVKQREHLEELTCRIEQAFIAIEELEKLKGQMTGLGWEAMARAYCDLALPRMEAARSVVDRLEMWVDHSLWPFPNTSELISIR